MTDDTGSPAQDPEQILAWEKRHRPRAAVAAFIAALAMLALNVLSPMLEADIPRPSGLEALQRGASTEPVAQMPSLQTPVFEYFHDEATLGLGVAISGLIGYIAIGWTAGFLGVATRARLPHIRRFVMYLPIVGGVLFGIAVMLSEFGRRQLVDDFLAGPRTVEAASALSSPLLDVARIMLPIGNLLLAVGTVIISLNAMRAGLLTRMLGYLGIAAGAFMVLVSLPIVQIFWLASVGFILVGRWPGGVPPAWRTGNAEPWPDPPPRQPRQPRQPATEGVSMEKTRTRRKRKKRN